MTFFTSCFFVTIDSDMWIIFCPLWQQVIGAKKIHVKGNKTYNDVVWILDNQVYNNSPIYIYIYIYMGIVPLNYYLIACQMMYWWTELSLWTICQLSNWNPNTVRI